MFPEYFATIGGAIAFASGFYYSYLTLRGKTRPSRITFALWGGFPVIIFAAQVAQGVGVEVLATLAAGVPSLITFIFSLFVARAYWHAPPRSFFFGFLALISIGLWIITDNPNIALAFALGANFMAALPTILKAYTNPESEHWHPYVLSNIGFLLIIGTMTEWRFESHAFLVYLIVSNALIAAFAIRAPNPALEPASVLRTSSPSRRRTRT